MGFLSDVGGFLADLGDGVGDGAEDLFKDLVSHVGAPDEMAAQLVRLAEQVEQFGRQLAQDAAKMSWQGDAADSFRQHTAHLTEQFGAVSLQLRDAAGLADKLV
jgi:uncharacterized protein YukE